MSLVCKSDDVEPRSPGGSPWASCAYARGFDGFKCLRLSDTSRAEFGNCDSLHVFFVRGVPG